MSGPVWSLDPRFRGIVRREWCHVNVGRVNSAQSEACGKWPVTCRSVLPVLALSLDPKEILNSLSPYGEIGLILIIFAETGLLIGFFLPGDSLLFTAGLLAEQGKLNLAVILVGCFVAAVIGDQVGFTDRAEGGTAPLPTTRLTPVQAGVRRPHGELLRAPRAEDDRHRALRSRRAHVRARCSRASAT